MYKLQFNVNNKVIQLKVNKIMMFNCVIFFSLLQIVLTNDQKGDCGCSVSNPRPKQSLDKSLFKQIKNENLEQCSLIKDPEKGTIENMVLIPEGEYQVGTDDVVIDNDMEGPKRMVKLNEFYIDKYEVSNKDFDSFVTSTNYKTEAETFGDSFVFTLFLNISMKEQLQDYRVVQAPWWYKVVGANWRHPYGSDSDISGNKSLLMFILLWKLHFRDPS